LVRSDCPFRIFECRLLRLVFRDLHLLLRQQLLNLLLNIAVNEIGIVLTLQDFRDPIWQLLNLLLNLFGFHEYETERFTGKAKRN
jgi:hypothetical protein